MRMFEARGGVGRPATNVAREDHLIATDSLEGSLPVRIIAGKDHHWKGPLPVQQQKQPAITLPLYLPPHKRKPRLRKACLQSRRKVAPQRRGSARARRAPAGRTRPSTANARVRGRTQTLTLFNRSALDVRSSSHAAVSVGRAGWAGQAGVPCGPERRDGHVGGGDGTTRDCGNGIPGAGKGGSSRSPGGCCIATAAAGWSKSASRRAADAFAARNASAKRSSEKSHGR